MIETTSLGLWYKLGAALLMLSAFILVKWQMHCVSSCANQEVLCWLTTNSLSSRGKTTRSLNFHYFVSSASFIYFWSNKQCLSIVLISFKLRLKIMHPIFLTLPCSTGSGRADSRVEFVLSWLMRLIKRLYCDINSLKNVLESQYQCLIALYRQGPCLKQH